MEHYRRAHAVRGAARGAGGEAEEETRVMRASLAELTETIDALRAEIRVH